MRRFTRHTFVAWAGGAGAGFYLFGRLPGMSAPVALAQIPGGTLDPSDVTKFVTPMLVPPVMPRTAVLRAPGGKPIDYYEISMKQFEQQILPAGMPPTTVWGYGGKAARSNRGLLVHNAPSLTIEAMGDRPVRVKWINELIDANGNYLPHLLPVDPTLHWANPPGGAAERDSRPPFAATPGPYTGPVPIVTHVHGAVGVHDDSDGYAERGTCLAPTTSRSAMPRKAPGTTSSPARRPASTASAGGRASPPSSTPTRTGRRRSGTTTTRSA
jgi:hypothetical protein